MKKILPYVAAVLGAAIFTTQVKAEEPLTVDVEGNLSLYQVPLNAIDTISGFLGNKQEPKYIYLTKDSLLIEDYQENQNEDGSVTVKMKVYNRSGIDGLVEIYDKKNTLVGFASQPIEGSKAPESFLESGERAFSELPYLLTRNILDIRNRAASSEIEFTLRPGDRAKITLGGERVLFYNVTVAVLQIADYLKDGNQSHSPNGKEVLLDFVKDMEFKTGSNILKDEALQVLASDRSLEEKFQSQGFINLARQLSQYLDKKSAEGLQDTVKDKLSDALENYIAKFGVVGKLAAAVSGAVNSFNKLTNIGVRLRDTVAAYNAKPPATSIALKADLQLAATQRENQLQPTRDSRTWLQNAPLQNFNSCITMYGSSHIGSAACFIGRSPAQDSVYGQQRNRDEARIPNLQEKSHYTDGVILQPPVDIVLTWNQNTKLDLDSHLTGPASADANSPVRFHVYWDARGNLNETPNALLYRDTIPDPDIGLTRPEQARTGPEQTRINTPLRLQPGVYRFYVNNFSSLQNGTGTPTGSAAGPTGLSNSGAAVQVYQAGTAVPNFDPNNPSVQGVGKPFGDPIFVPTGQQGNVWQVFELDSRTGILRRVNQPLGNVSDPAQVPSVNPAEFR
ncbi:hypothetical protein [Kamptonema formosum]|uniref:hypothetical protein n=1 Tax=Kamptonema formosum TaxID=331992 RepID=UPI0003478CF0|nr:hypothetical protein [Oscillatoria sp. PCC 10802]